MDEKSGQSIARRPYRILLVNPNSSTDMTRGMEAAARSVASNSVELLTHTASDSAPASINDRQTIEQSVKAVFGDFVEGPHRNSGSDNYDAILVACFSAHPLVAELRRWSGTVTGIFEASILTALSITEVYGQEQWGIVTTGKFWEDHLADGVHRFLGHEDRDAGGYQNTRFAGVYSTGLNADDFHKVRPEEVRARLKEATTNLLKPRGSSTVRCVVMGCGGMAGLEDIIRSTAAEVYGQERAGEMYIVDGVKAGILQLEQTLRSKSIFG